MLKILTFFLLIFALPLSAKVLISPIDAMKATYGSDATVSKKNILLSKQKAKLIEQKTKSRLKSKIFRIFKATKESQLLGYGILINQQVRSKNTAVLYFISNDSMLKAIEIIAFNEPMEYLPSKKWNEQFNNTKTTKMLQVSKNIPTISGATLSAKAITDASRIAFGIYNELLKD